MFLFLFAIILWLIFTISGIIYFSTVKIVSLREREEIKNEEYEKKSKYKIIMNPEYKTERKEVSIEKTVIVGLLAIYESSIVEPFFNSLRRSGYSGEIVSFTLSKNISSYYEIYKKYEVKYILFKNKYPYYISNNKNYPISKEVLRNMSKIPYDRYYYANIRFFLIYYWLLVYSSNFSYILTVDIRDTIFQENPFHWNYKRGIYLSHESKECRYTESKNCSRCNYDWFNNLNPRKELFNNTFINAGQIFGSSVEMRYFIGEFTKVMYEIHLKKRIRIDTCDQGILNLYVYNTSEFEYPVYIFEGVHGFVRCVGLDLMNNKYGYEPNDNLTIMNEDGTMPVMIHQYDVGLKHGSIVRRIKYRHFYEKYVNI